MPRNFKEAARWYGSPPTGGDREAQFALGMMYLEGRGVAADPAKAGRLFREGRRPGPGRRHLQLSPALSRRQGPPARTSAAPPRCSPRRPTPATPTPSTCSAQLYDDGNGVPRTRRRAARWFAEAANAGHVPAEVEYAIRLFNGIGSRQGRGRPPRSGSSAPPTSATPSPRTGSPGFWPTGAGMPADPVAAAKWHFLAGAPARPTPSSTTSSPASARQRKSAVAAASASGN